MSQLFNQVINKSTFVCQYRSSPNHKAVIVKFVKNSKQLGYPVTLAVGDGANDVNMIEAANIGVGIFGNEGSQSASTAEYAIHRFN